MQANEISKAQIMDAYMEFIAVYGRSYASRDEIDQRYDVFEQNYLEIIEHNSIPNVPFEMEVNQFADVSEAEFYEKYTGGLQMPARFQNKSDEKPKLYRSRHSEPSESSNIPSYLNWYEKGAVTRPHFSQGTCGSCWAFATASTLESIAYISGFDKELQYYSLNQVLECDEQNYGCGGGWMYEGYEYARDNGIALENEYRKYSGHANRCANKFVSHFYPSSMEEEDEVTVQRLKELVQKQPIGVAIHSTHKLQKYKKGIVTEEFLKCSDSNSEVNHGVVLVGYGKYTNEEVVFGHCQEYFIIRNSWGPDWGEEGFFKLCVDELSGRHHEYGTCLITKFSTWPIA